MAISQEVIVLNGAATGLEERRRTSSRGTKSRYTITIKSEPVLHQFDALALGKGPAEAIQRVIQEGIRRISEAAKPATIAKRRSAARALAKGEAWAVKRYAGGRTGETEPNQSDRLFNDSGRLAGGIFTRENKAEGSWTVNVPANRFDPSTFGSVGQMDAMIARLQTLVPELGDPAALARHESVRRAIETSLTEAIAVATRGRSALRGELLRRVSGLVRQLATLGQAVIG